MAGEQSGPEDHGGPAIDKEDDEGNLSASVNTRSTRHKKVTAQLELWLFSSMVEESWTSIPQSTVS